MRRGFAWFMWACVAGAFLGPAVGVGVFWTGAVVGVVVAAGRAYVRVRAEVDGEAAERARAGVWRGWTPPE